MSRAADHDHVDANDEEDDDDEANNVNYPPGFRFSPTEEELLGFYLKNKLEGRGEKAIEGVIPVTDLYRFDPWQLPGEYSRNIERSEQWFFFCPWQERELHGGRLPRTTPSGYWKATGSPSLVYSSSNRDSCRVMGLKKTMVFYTGRAPSGRKTEWKMNEYRALQQDIIVTNLSRGTPKLRNEFSLCRVYFGTLRSFDRRPPPTNIEASSSNANLPPAQRTSSHDSSSLCNDTSSRTEEVEGAALDWNSLLNLLDWD